MTWCYYFVFLLSAATSFTYCKNITLCIVIPTYNEEQRISPTLAEYVEFFSYQKNINTTFLVVANNCSDQTVPICKKLQRQYKNLQILDFPKGGKGFAVKQGFAQALQKNYDLIGFVDADLATKPQYFYELISPALHADGAIASRYIAGANVWPKRPWLKKIGGKVFNFALRQSLDLPFKDTQCGAKVFKAHVLQTIVPYMEEQGWVFDLELLYLAKLHFFNVVEVPTTWSDMPGSHLRISSVASEFLSGISRIKTRHKPLYRVYKKERHIRKLKRRLQRKCKNENSNTTPQDPVSTLDF